MACLFRRDFFHRVGAAVRLAIWHAPAEIEVLKLIFHRLLPLPWILTASVLNGKLTARRAIETFPRRCAHLLHERIVRVSRASS